MLRKYTKEFKQQAVELAISLGNTSEAGRKLGVPDTNMYEWKQKFGKKQSNKQALRQSETEELLRLRQENAELKKVNHILKSAAAFFSQDHLR